MRYEEFDTLVRNSFVEGGEIRWGQHWFNTLNSVNPLLANEIRSTKLDPFHRDERVEDASEYVRGKWSTISDEQAMDQIADILSVPEWSPDCLDFIADVVRMTGRTYYQEEVNADATQL